MKYLKLKPVDRQSIDFSEIEREKSKNLIPYPYKVLNGTTSRGVEFTCNSDTSINLHGTSNNQSSGALFSLVSNFKLNAGKYKISLNQTQAGIGIEVFNVYSGDTVVETYKHLLYSGELSRGFTLTQDVVFDNIYLVVYYGATVDLNNIKILLEKVDDINDSPSTWQEYNGEIIHKRQLEEITPEAFVYSTNTGDTAITLTNEVAGERVVQVLISETRTFKGGKYLFQWNLPIKVDKQSINTRIKIDGANQGNYTQLSSSQGYQRVVCQNKIPVSAGEHTIEITMETTQVNTATVPAYSTMGYFCIRVV